MKYLNVPIYNRETKQEEISKEIVYNYSDFPYSKILYEYSTVREHGRGKYRKNYINVSAAFDIETTTVSKELSFMYQWQMCIGIYAIFGRTWSEFCMFLERLEKELELNENKKLVIYVHNLSYEFQFMKDFITIDNLFATEKRKVLKFESRYFEFRCSYRLSNMSLAKFCENSKLCSHYKLSDTYDYKKLRTPQTLLTEIEESYCYNDVRGLCECIDSLLLDDTIATIPLTSTGYVRRDMANACRNTKYFEFFQRTSLNDECYMMLKRAFRGGNTHANAMYTGHILKDIYSFDKQSSYPSYIMMGYYPITKFIKLNLPIDDIQEVLDTKCCIFDIEFFNIVTKKFTSIPYIDIAHCTKRKNILADNGRVVQADYLKMTLTEIDLLIIKSQYDYDGIITNMYVAERGEMPKEIRDCTMSYYEMKTQLKDIEGKEYYYTKAKNKLNSCYGMMVTDLVHDIIMLTLDGWTVEKADITDSLNKYYKSKRNFLPYQFGVYITAHARYGLQLMIDAVGTDCVYVDTDSVKFRNAEHILKFIELNNKIIEECNEKNAYCERDGERYYLGVWEDDGHYTDFCTLGAKKYAYNSINKKGESEFHITVSGMAKKAGANAIGCIENFKPDISKAYTDIGRTVSYYIDEPVHTITVDGCTFDTASSIAILDTTYTLGITSEYMDYINAIQNNSINYDETVDIV